VRLPVPQVTWRRTNELGDLMRVLELGAVHLDDRARIPKQNLCGSLHNPCLPRPSRPQKQQVPHRPPRRVQPCTEHLIHVDQGLHALGLTHNLRSQCRLKLASVCATYSWIQLMPNRRFHGSFLLRPSPRRAVRLTDAYTEAEHCEGH